MGKCEIAVIGIGCKLPGGVNSPAQFIEFLCRHGDGVREIPPDRWNPELHYSENLDAAGKCYVRRGCLLDHDPFSFDPIPFGISPLEAEKLDPQQRLLLEVSWQAFEDAGLPIARLRGTNVGVFIGGFTSDYRELSTAPQNQGIINSHTSVGASMTVLSNRISYTYDLRGPSLTVDTACSSSLVAVHLACRSLMEKESEVALAGGVNVMISPGATIIMCKGKFLAPDGRSKAFDAAADGYGRGEGAGIVVLKRLEDAVKDDDLIYAVIRATGVNQDGRTDGMPMPSGPAQVKLAKDVLSSSGFSAADVLYCEAHGTGTKVGDPIEVQALSSVYKSSARGPLKIGSVKTNIGHLEAAAGIAGLIKSCLSVSNRTIYPQRSLDTPNPNIPFQELGVEVALKVEKWPDHETAVAAVNSFGYGGTNAHVIVSEPPARRPKPSERPLLDGTALPFSATSRAGVQEYARELETFLINKRCDPIDLAYTLSLRREHHRFRGIVSGRNDQELIDALRLFNRREFCARAVEGERTHSPRLLFVYTGMGPQHWAMGQTLFRQNVVYRETVEQIDRLFYSQTGWSILHEMLKPQEQSQMHRNCYAQPGNFVLQVGLTEVLKNKGIIANGILGHSVGEVTAAWASGCLNLEQAVRVSAIRSQLQQRAAGRGTMLAVSMTPSEGEELSRRYRDVSVAAYNSPRSIALAGNKEELAEILNELRRGGIFARMMKVEVAYHSPHMDPLRDDFLKELKELKPVAPQRFLYSTALGRRIESPMHDSKYWWLNARNPVALAEALGLAFQDGFNHFLEVGPHPVLSAAIAENGIVHHVKPVTHHTLHREKDEIDAIEQTINTLFVTGCDPEWSKLAPKGNLIPTPGFPFQRSRFWDESHASKMWRVGDGEQSSLLGQKLPMPNSVYSCDLARPSLSFLADHRIQEKVIFPAAGYVEAMLSAAADKVGKVRMIMLKHIEFKAPLLIRYDSSPTLHTVLSDLNQLKLSSRHEEGVWTENATGEFAQGDSYRPSHFESPIILTQGIPQFMVSDDVYKRFEERGLQYTNTFRCIEQIWHCQAGERRRVIARLKPATVKEYRGCMHPALLDGALQALLTLEDTFEDAVVPVSIGELRWFPIKFDQAWVEGEIEQRSDEAIAGNVRLLTENGDAICIVQNLVCRPISPSRQKLDSLMRQWVHTESWPVQTLDPETVLNGTVRVIGNEADCARLIEIDSALNWQASLEIDDWKNISHVVLVGDSKDPSSAESGDLMKLIELLPSLRQNRIRLSLVTRDAFPISDTDSVQPAHTALAGFGRVIMTECPELDCRLIDLPLQAKVEDLKALAQLLVRTGFDECAIRQGRIHHRTILRSGPQNEERRQRVTRESQKEARFDLFIETPGKIDSLAWRPVDVRPLGEEEVEIQVECATLNFKDLMKVMDMLSDTALHRTYLGDTLGMEAVGTVVRKGAGVKRYRIGDRVNMFTGSALSSHAIAREPLCSFVHSDDPLEAASYFAYIAAYQALKYTGRLEKGERVLIHSATGGVGLACVYYALNIGAEIFATAGTQEKRDYLKSIGIKYVYDSRTLDYADQLLADTRSEGVHVLVNSLSGPPFVRNFDLLAAGGRYVELGKQDLAGNTRLGLLPFNKGIGFTSVDIDRRVYETNVAWAPPSEDVYRDFRSGRIRPLPNKIYRASEIAAAFREFAKGKHIGRFVIDFRNEPVDVKTGLRPKVLFQKDKAYLFTGGLSGFGLKTAMWASKNGAGTVILASRRGKIGREDQDKIKTMEEYGSRVLVKTVDLTQWESVVTLFAEIKKECSPLDGIFHAAMVLHDLPLQDLTKEALEEVLLPKAKGAWHLHICSEKLNLDLNHFICYSSISALVGNPNQAAYVCANAYLEGLIHYRRRLGLSGTAVAWGAIGEVGVVARDYSTQAHLKALGFNLLNPDIALKVLGRIMEEDFRVVSVADIDWNKWIKSAPNTPWLRLREVAGSETAEPSDFKEEIRTIRDNAGEEAARTTILERVANIVCSILNLSSEQFEADKTLNEYGIDSLLAVELQLTLESNCGINFTTIELLGGRSTHDIAEKINSITLDDRTESSQRNQKARKRAESPEALRDAYLEQICVQPPYFSLEGMGRTEDGVIATAYSTAHGLYEASAYSIAEAARHAAILGSCAVRDAIATTGRIYFPVQSARLIKVSLEDQPTPLSEACFNARLTHIDHFASVATAEASVHDRADRHLASFEITYNIIPEREFCTLFAAHHREEPEDFGDDPYRKWQSISDHDIHRMDGNRWQMTLGTIKPTLCSGHFVGYPAYPVSIMLRHAIDFVGRILSETRSNQNIKFKVIGGASKAHRFIFANQNVFLTALQHDPSGDFYSWTVNIHSVDGMAASFTLELVLKNG